MQIFDDASDLIKFQFRYIKMRRGLERAELADLHQELVTRANNFKKKLK